MPGFLDGLLEAGKDVLEQQAGEMLSKLGPEVLDSVVDKLIISCMEAIKEAGLDPLPIPDITVPYSLDKMSGVCAPFLKDSKSPAAQLLGGLFSCLAKTMEIEGDLLLSEGLLSGLSGLSRSKSTEISVSDGVAKLASTLAVVNLQCPFSVSNSNADMEIPKMEAKVNQINLKLGVDIPLSRDSSHAGLMEFEPKLEELPIELDMDLGELGPLEKIIRPLIVDPVRKRLVIALRDEVTKIVKEKVQKIGLSSLLE